MAKLKRGLLLSGTTALLGAGTVVAGMCVQTPTSWAIFNSPKETVREAWQLINRSYLDRTFNGVDWTAAHQEYVVRRSYETPEDAYGAIREMLEPLEDPYTRFLDPKEYKDLKISTSGKLTGVGIQIAQDEKTKNVVVVSPIEGSPAFEAGLQAEDIILKVDNTSTQGLDLQKVVSMIRGPIGTQVTLTIGRGQQQLRYTITRANISIQPVRFDVQSTPTGKVGYIRLTQFNSNATAQMRAAIRQLEQQQVQGYLLDLRANPGGLLFAGTDIARMWINRGTIVSTVGRQGELSRITAQGRNLTNKPLVVLVDGGSASASEILAGALQDHRRAVLVGTKTFGKGLVQSVRPFQDGSGLVVTIAKYLTPQGRDINKTGIVPDITVELTETQKQKLTRKQIGTAADPQYAKALTVLNQRILAHQR